MPNTDLIQTSFKDPLLSVSLSCPLAPIPIRPGSPLRLWRYINHLLTYSLTYLELVVPVLITPIQYPLKDGQAELAWVA